MTLIIFLLVSLIGSANTALVKFTVHTFPPFTLVAIRSLLAALLILPFISHKKMLSEKSDKGYLFLANLLFAANWLFFATGIQYTSVIMGQMIYVPTALIVAVIGYLFLKEKLTIEQIIGLILTIIGMLILLYGSITSQDLLSFGKPIGNLIIIAGLLSWSLYTVVSRKISSIYQPAIITFFNFVASFLVASMLIPLEAVRGLIALSKINQEAIFALFGLVIFSSILFFLLYQWLIKHTSAFISSLVLYPVTIFGSFVGIIFFNEKMTFNFILGAFLAMVGVFLATSRKYLRSYQKL